MLPNGNQELLFLWFVFMNIFQMTPGFVNVLVTKQLPEHLLNVTVEGTKNSQVTAGRRLMMRTGPDVTSGVTKLTVQHVLAQCYL